MTRRGELLLVLAGLAQRQAAVLVELAALEGAAVAPARAPRPRARPARVVASNDTGPHLTDLDAAAAQRIRDGVARKLRIQPR